MGEAARKEIWLTPAEAAAALQIPESSVRYLCRKGRFVGAAKHPRMGWRIPGSALDGSKPTQSIAEGVAQTAEIAARWKAEGRYDKPKLPRVDIVYVVRAGNSRIVKIGHTIDMAKRLSFLQIGSPAAMRCLVTLPGGKEVEAGLHERFRHLRVRGEWFTYGPELRSFVREQKRAQQKERI